MTPVAVALFTIAGCLVVAANGLYFKMVAQVNQQLPPGRRFSFMVMYPGNGMSVAREHRRLYPGSKLRFLSNLLFTAAVVLFLVALWKLGFFT